MLRLSGDWERGLGMGEGLGLRVEVWCGGGWEVRCRCGGEDVEGEDT